MKPQAVARMTAMVEQVIERGTGKKAQIRGIRVAGKTGSPQEDSGQTNAIFIGFAPAEKPRLAIAVVVDGGKTGGSVAAPLAAEMIRAAVKP